MRIKSLVFWQTPDWLTKEPGSHSVLGLDYRPPPPMSCVIICSGEGCGSGDPKPRVLLGFMGCVERACRCHSLERWPLGGRVSELDLGAQGVSFVCC